jgi:hypothetical protein
MKIKLTHNSKIAVVALALALALGPSERNIIALNFSFRPTQMKAKRNSIR